MNRYTIATIMLMLGCASPAMAGALDECQTSGDHAAINRCLREADAQAQASLRNAEAAAGTRAREIDNATGRSGANAALAKTLRPFADYRTAQCDYIRALYASGTGAEEAMLGCRVDITRRRVRELQP